MCATDNLVESDPLQRTALYSLHQSLNAKLVPFTAYLLPVQYTEGIKAEHLHTRAHAGLFDVSHMGQIFIRGSAVDKAFEKLVTGDISGLRNYQQRYTLLTNSEGGIIDDLMVTKMPEGLIVVVNAACKSNDFAYIKEQLGTQYQFELMNDLSLLALQGPKAVKVLGAFDEEITRLAFMQAGRFEIEGVKCTINRCGYTGEDGFEISVDNKDAEQLARLFLENDVVRMIGLGARDSLRLEAGLCLYGHDIGDSTTPVEANLRWAIAPRYRDGSVKASFPGARKILQQVQEGTEKLLVGIQPEGKMPVREGVKLLNKNKLEIGTITSGGFGASVGRPVAMAYVSTQYAAIGTELHVEIRNRSHTMRVAELPFVLHQYFKP